MAQHDNIAKELIRRYKEDVKCDTFIYVQYGEANVSTMLTLSNLKEITYKAIKHKMKKFHPVSIDPIQSDQIHSYCFGLKLGRYRHDKLTYSDMSGMFKITFSDGSILYFAKWLSGLGRNQKLENVYATEKEVWIKFLNFLKGSMKERLKPKNGIFKIEFIANIATGKKELVYRPLKDLNETPIVHPEIKNIEGDMNFFYDNIPFFTRYKRPGIRKIILVGEPGTGKTSFCVRLAKKVSSNICFVFATSIEVLAAHLIKCNKYGVKTIGVLEDAEQTLSGANSALLNFLDGIDQPPCKLGAYIIMTTNFPNAIEKRILQRPGRVDKVFRFDALKGQYALRCLEIYLNIFLESEDEKNILNNPDNKQKLIKLVNGMTGTQIKALIDATLANVTSTTQKLSLKILEDTKNQMFSDLNSVYEYAKDESLNGAKKKIGFSTNSVEKIDEFEPYSIEEF